MSDYVRLIKPEYEVLKLKPNNSIRNSSTDKIARTIFTINQSITQRVKTVDEKWLNFMGKSFRFPTKFDVHTFPKVSFLIYMERKIVDFYFIVPKDSSTYLKEKMNDVWKGVTIEKVEDVPCIEDSIKNQLYFVKEDGLSLTIDRRDNDLINSILNNVEILENEEYLSVIYNFNNTSQKGWKNTHASTITRFNEHRPVDRNKTGLKYLIQWGIILLDDVINTVFSAIANENIKKKNNNDLMSSILTKLGQEKKLTTASLNKGSMTVGVMELIVACHSQDFTRRKNLLRSLSQSFDTISGDNSLVAKPFNKKVNIRSRYLGAEKNIVSDQESQHFLSLVGKDILERYKFIDHIETHETQVPEELQSGVMSIGTNTYRGHRQKAFISNDFEFRNLLLLLIAPTRAGKSNLIGHLSIDAVENNECVIIVDYIMNCELSDSVSRLFPSDQVLTIDCSNPETLQGLGYNEVGVSEDVFTQYRLSKQQTASIISLINSVNVGDARLSPKMERYLESAALIAFTTGGCFRDVYRILTSHHVRSEFISKIEKKHFEYLEEYIDSLLELDEINKDVVIGTKLNLITGIIDRFTVLKRNPYMEMMLKKDTSKNISLVEEIEKNQVILIKMPQHLFQTDEEKDTLALYWLTKIWVTLIIRAEKIKDRKKRKKLNIVYDEIYQIKNTEIFLKSILSQIAKFTAKPIISCHYINQLTNLRPELRSANTSYMLFSGCDKDNFNELKTELHPFEVEDLLNLKSFHSLNHIKTKEGYSTFITELPHRVELRKPKIINEVDVIISDSES